MNFVCKCEHCNLYHKPTDFISLINHSDNKIRLVKWCIKCRKRRNYSQNKNYREKRPTTELHHKGFH